MVEFKVAFVLRLVDEFSGKTIINKKFRFQIDGQKAQVVEKAEGLYVFLQPQPQQVRVSISSSDYYDCEVLVDRAQLNPAEPVAQVRLFGKPGRDFPYRCELLTGQLENRKVEYPAVVYALSPVTSGLVLKDVKKVENQNILQLNGFTKEKLVGKTYALGTGKNAETFVFVQKRGMNEYIVEGSLQGKHKAGEPVTRAYRSVTDTEGGYAIPVDFGSQQSITEVMVLQNKAISS